MGTLTALALATPIFGFALTPPAPATPAHSVGASLAPGVVAQLDVAGGADAEVEGEAGGGQDDYVNLVRRRAQRAKVHRSLGIATWAAMTLTVASGTVQFRNLYGAWDDLADTPCVTGDAWPSQSTCSGHPVGHLVLGVTTASLYAATLGLSYAMPDPDHADEGDSKFARRLRTHKALRWVHLGGMVAQMVLGVLVANPHLMGMDRTENYDTLKALSTVHLTAGFVTWGAMTAAGGLLLF